MSIRRRVDKEDVVHIYNGVLLGQKKKNLNNAISQMWIDLETVIQSEVGQIKMNIIY